MDGIIEISKGIVSIAAALTIFVGVIVSLIKISNGMKCLLRADMLQIYYKHIDDKKIRQYEMENFEHEYAAYKALHGNSFVDEIYKKVHEWTVVS